MVDVVYFILDPKKQHVKIGFTTNINRRFAQHQTSNSSELILINSIPGSKNDEAEYKKKFQHLKVLANRKGNEWYRYEAELYNFLNPKLDISLDEIFQ